MSEHDDSQERTEDASEKRVKESKEKGQIARSKDLNTTILLVGGIGCFMFFSQYIGEKALHVMVTPFEIIQKSNEVNMDLLFQIFTDSLYDAIALILPFILIVLLGAIIGSLVVGGWVFSWENVIPKFERIDPLKGLQRIFSIKTVVELAKSILKFILIATFATVVFYLFFDELLALNFVDPKNAIIKSCEILVFSIFLVSLSLVIISAIDAPFQIWQHLKQLKMTKQEVKEEHKETNGSPELKARIAKLQREHARRRMMDKIPQADVVITNPDHFAVALKYDESKSGAPILVAKGADIIAEKIKQVAHHHDVPIVSMPPLARSIFYFTELDEEIPGDLYVAVAQVLAYVYQLKMFQKGKAKRPKLPKEVPIPETLRR